MSERVWRGATRRLPGGSSNLQQVEWSRNSLLRDLLLLLLLLPSASGLAMLPPPSSVGPERRVADPVHFRLDLDQAKQNFKNQIRILLALTKNQLKHLNFFRIEHISSDI